MPPPNATAPVPPQFHCYFLLWLPQVLLTIKPGEDLRDDETLVSPNRVFELGFFNSSSKSSSKHYSWEYGSRMAQTRNSFG
ncbi:hypothetical protein SLA2020_351100 [Shorea laevis]